MNLFFEREIINDDMGAIVGAPMIFSKPKPPEHAIVTAAKNLPDEPCKLDTDGDGNCHVHPKGCPGKR